jgi:hypothetical protein
VTEVIESPKRMLLRGIKAQTQSNLGPVVSAFHPRSQTTLYLFMRTWTDPRSLFPCCSVQSPRGAREEAGHITSTLQKKRLGVRKKGGRSVVFSALVSRKHYISDSRISQRGITIKPTVNPKIVFRCCAAALEVA